MGGGGGGGDEEKTRTRKLYKRLKSWNLFLQETTYVVQLAVCS